MIRITADLDNTLLSVAKARALAIEAYLHARYHILINSFNVYYSSSHKGCHVILWTEQKLDKTKILFIRALLGDDPSRLMRDIRRRRPKQYLFDNKKMLRRKS